MKRTTAAILFLATALLLSGCKGDPLTYRKGKAHDLADRVERFADALDEKFRTEGISDEEWTLYKEAFEQYGSELANCFAELDEEERTRIAHAAGRISGIALGQTADEIDALFDQASTLLPEYFEGLKEAFSGGETE